MRALRKALCFESLTLSGAEACYLVYPEDEVGADNAPVPYEFAPGCYYTAYAGEGDWLHDPVDWFERGESRRQRIFGPGAVEPPYNPTYHPKYADYLKIT